MAQQSMTRRLILWLTATIAGFWLLAVGLGAVVMYDEFAEIFDSSLQETTERLVPLVMESLSEHAPTADARLLAGATAASSDEYLTYQVRDAAGRVLLRSHDAAKEPFAAPLTQGFWENEQYRYYTAASVSGTTFVQVADSLDNRREALIEGGTALLLPLAVLIPSSALVVWFLVGRTIAPIDDLRRGIAGKDSGNLAELDLPSLPSELQPIAQSVNLLLSRLRAALDAEREFTANSAHELRTPIAGALAQTQMLIGQLKDSSAKSRANQIETSLMKLAHLTEKLLQLARAEAGIGVTGSAVNLGKVLDVVVEDFRRAAADPGRMQYHRDPDAQLVAPISEDAFAIIVRNLIENALTHGAPDQPVDIRLSADGKISVANGSPPLSQMELAAIRKRFTRGRTTAQGSGLGLSIVDRLLAGTNARLILSSPVAGRTDGFEARIEFTPST